MQRKIILLILILCLCSGISAYSAVTIEEVENNLVFSSLKFNDYKGGNYGSIISGKVASNLRKSDDFASSDGASMSYTTSVSSDRLTMYYASGDVTTSSVRDGTDADYINYSYDVNITPPSDWESFGDDVSKRLFKSYVVMEDSAAGNEANWKWLKITPQFHFRNGKVALRIEDITDERYIDPGVWYTIEHKFDFTGLSEKNPKISYVINVINKVTGVTDAEFKSTFSVSGCTKSIRKLVWETGSVDGIEKTDVAGTTFRFDNFKFTDGKEDLAFTAYDSATELDITDTVSFTVRIPGGFTSAGVYLGDARLAEITQSNITDFYKVSVPVVDFAPMLTLGTAYNLSLKATYEDNDEISAEYETPVVIKEIHGFNVCSLKFTLNGSEYISSDQLSDTNIFGVNTLIVSGDAESEGIMLLTLRDGKKLISVTAKDFAVGNSLQNIELTLPEVGKLSNPVLECMLIKDLKTCMPYTPSFIK